MANPTPSITFRVKTYDPVKLSSTLIPDQNRDNIIRQLENQTVWAPYWPYGLKHGDEFTLYGDQALRLKRELDQLNAHNNTILEIVS